ncbi:MAG: hypothetical protein CMJ79_06685 [Planctomycetaceae bacterium]|nr:hypothetical protein [Planctomycetaceae bacterium]|tara:strand:- start:241 stop:915 length:675 start_codon:yes stop_codon:yes gene_type:complete
MKKMTWRKFFYILLGLAMLLVLGALYILYLVRSVPERYYNELQRPPYVHQDPVEELLEVAEQVQSDIRFGDDLDFEITEKQINGWLATNLESNPSVSLPAGIKKPRLFLDDQGQQLFFTIERSRFSSAISIHLTVHLTTEPNVVEVRLKDIRAGSLPIRIKRVFDEIESAMARSGVDFKWKAGTDRTVGIVRIPTEVRVKRDRQLTVTGLEFGKGKVRVTAEVD